MRDGATGTPGRGRSPAAGGDRRPEAMHAAPLGRRCRFATARLSVATWRERQATTEGRAGFAARLVEILTPEVARTLPPAWRRVATVDDALDRIDAAGRDGDAFAVETRETGRVVGCLFLYAAPAATAAGLDVRVGYFLAREVWGCGLGTELVGGLVDWCEAAEDVRRVTGVVEVGNVASARVLEKNGFRRTSVDAGAGMAVFERPVGAGCRAAPAG